VKGFDPLFATHTSSFQLKMVNKVVIYTGAPESHALDWNPSKLLPDFEDSVAGFVGLTRDPPVPAIPSQPASMHAAWRSILLEKDHVAAGSSQQQQVAVFSPYDTGAGEYLDASFTEFNDSGLDHDLVSDFYEESIVAHQQEPVSSQLVAVEGESQITTTTSFSSDMNTTSFISTTSTKQPLPMPGAGGAGAHLSDLKDIPSATYILAIQPQTMTCNLIVGIISLPPPRAVKTRWGSSHRLVEALVGDDSRSGFAVTFWLPASGNEKEAEPLAQTLSTLRLADVVLLQNVALNVFSKRVYGYSLRRGLTRAHLLYRVKTDATDSGGYYTTSDLRLSEGALVHPQLEKTARVRDWVARFVRQGPQGEQRKKGEARQGPRAWDVMPPVDTQ